MQVVSFKTARRLKAAGFPQPEFKTDDLWYDTVGTSFWAHVRLNTVLSQPACFFAPSPTDILKELGITYSFGYNEKTGLFECFVNEYEEWWRHVNPAEACAEAWLAKHEKV